MLLVRPISTTSVSALVHASLRALPMSFISSSAFRLLRPRRLLTFVFYAVKKFRPQDTAWFVAAVFTLLTVVYSLREVIKHLQNYTLPQLQTNICRIILMPPVYAVASFLQLRLLQQGVYIGCARELYEALTVYSFMHLMTDFLHELAKLKQTDIVALLNGPDGEGQPMIHHKMPVKLLEKAGLIKPWKMESVDARGQPVSPFYRVTTLGVLQYVPVACFCAAMATVLELLGVYHEAKISLKSGWLYLVILRNLSQFVALYSLVMFYHGSKKLLYELRPLPKFLSIKLVIFFTFWQKLVLIGLKHYDLLPIHSLYEREYQNGALNSTERAVGISTWGDDISTPELFKDLASAGIQNLLITMEMFIATLAHRHVFSYKEYQAPTQNAAAGGLPFASALAQMMDPTPAFQEVQDRIGQFTGGSVNSVSRTASGNLSGSI